MRILHNLKQQQNILLGIIVSPEKNNNHKTISSGHNWICSMFVA